MIPRTVRIALPAAVLALAWGCASPSVQLTAAAEAYEKADYYQAYRAIERAREEFPSDPEVEAAYWRIRQAYLLSEGQRLVFSGDEQFALDHFEMVLALDPDHEIALRWKDKALRKLATRAAQEGERLLRRGSDGLDPALRAFDRALRYDPSNRLAREGLEKLRTTWAETQEEARGHYLAGLRALGQHEYFRTRYHLDLALERDPTLTEARDPAMVAARQLAAERLAAARAMEEQGYFAAALQEYVEIERRHENTVGIDHEELAARMARAETEVKAARMADEGEMLVFRGEFAKAREVLEEAFAMTTRQKEAIAERLLLVRERELDARYVAAADLELQNLLDQSVAAYVAIEEDVPGFRDVRARIADLQLRIDEAEKAYAAGVAAQDAGDLDAAIQAFGDVQLFWKGFADSAKRLEALRAQRAAASGRS